MVVSDLSFVKDSWGWILWIRGSNGREWHKFKFVKDIVGLILWTRWPNGREWHKFVTDIVVLLLWTRRTSWVGLFFSSLLFSSLLFSSLAPNNEVKNWPQAKTCPHKLWWVLIVYCWSSSRDIKESLLPFSTFYLCGKNVIWNLLYNFVDGYLIWREIVGTFAMTNY